METERIILRGFVQNDLDRLVEIMGDPLVMRYMPGSKPLPRQSVEASFPKIDEHWRRHGFGRWAVLPKSEEAIIGWCGLEIVEELSEIELLYLLDSRYWGRGYATEAAQESLGFGFLNKGFDRIIGLAFPENKASRRVMEKNGMVYEKKVNLWKHLLVKYFITKNMYVRHTRSN